ncbi:MAG: preprotein translocase subunit Sec61beta [Candidatus Nanoarchaeia archaeon]
MAKDNKISMPSGIGGLTRYFDEYQSNVRIKPGQVVIICVVIILIMVFLHLRGLSFLGL